jgi:hypothetical protein
VIERVVENWLTSANERQYQIPFCQLLAAEGETILHISTHGQLEQGKDVISRTPNGTINAYQLKGGNLTLSDWRKYQPEVHELVVFDIEHPSVGRRQSHKSFLVTNGRVAETVINAIQSSNRVWSRMKAKPLTLVAGNELAKRFVKAHGHFLPRNPKDFQKFLQLIVDSGASQFDKTNFAAFLESILPLSDSTKTKPRDVQRSIASAVLFTTYIIQGCQRVQNNWAIFEAWTLMGAYVAAVAGRNRTSEAWWGLSFDLCVLGATRALDDLAEECASNQRKFTQGDPFTDGHFYKARLTLLAGLLAAATLSSAIRKETNWKHRDFVRRFLDDYLPKAHLWGESAVPYFMLAALATEKHGNHSKAEGLILQLVRSLAELNGSKGRGVPNPYYEPEEALRINFGLEDLNAEVFAGHAYTLEPMVQFLARRLLRRHLTLLWERVTRVHFARFDAKEKWESFIWRARNGSMVTTFPRYPQSWRELLTESETAPKTAASCFRRKPEFLLYFCLTFPHRFTPDLLKTIEHALP